MRVIWMFLLYSISHVTYCQSSDSLVNELGYTQFDTPPEFPGGFQGFKKYIDKNMNWRQGQLTVGGKVFVEFVVEKDGSITNPEVLKSLCKTCDEEAIRLIREMPKWRPATVSGRPVRVRMVLPVEFKL